MILLAKKISSPIKIHGTSKSLVIALFALCTRSSSSFATTMKSFLVCSVLLAAVVGSQAALYRKYTQ